MYLIQGWNVKYLYSNEYYTFKYNFEVYVLGAFPFSATLNRLYQILEANTVFLLHYIYLITLVTS